MGMYRRLRAAVIGVVSIALLVSLVGVLPAVASVPPQPSCKVTASPHTVLPYGHTTLEVAIKNGPRDVTLSSAITVTWVSRPSATATKVADLATGPSGTGVVSVVYPTQFSHGTTQYPGEYQVSVTVTGHSAAVSCSTNFAVMSRR